VAELAAALYPFAPRRARISAERCYHMLKNAGLVSTELELASAYPPAISSARVTTSSLNAAAPRTTTPAALDIRIPDDQAPTAAAKTRSKWLSFAAVGALSAGIALFAVKGRLLGAATPVAAAPAAAGQPVVAPAAPRAPTNVLDLDLETPSAATGAASGKPGSAASSGTASRASAKPAKAPRPAHVTGAAGKRARGSDDELDPGF
jgi:hypothetical protein